MYNAVALSKILCQLIVIFLKAYKTGITKLRICFNKVLILGSQYFMSSIHILFIFNEETK